MHLVDILFGLGTHHPCVAQAQQRKVVLGPLAEASVTLYIRGMGKMRGEVREVDTEAARKVYHAQHLLAAFCLLRFCGLCCLFSGLRRCRRKDASQHLYLILCRLL